jgi:hypothetical protein
MKPTAITSLVAAACLFLPLPAPAQHALASTQVVLPAGGQATTFNGVIRGHGTAEYVFQAPAGSKLQVSLKSSNEANYFNVLRDGKDDPLFIGSVNGTNAVLALRDSGTYRVKVYLMRNAARKNEEARYELVLR